MITSIQIREHVKRDLEKFKENAKDSYEDAILRLMDFVEEQKRKQEDLLIEGYKEMTKESLKITKEFENIDEDFDWEWDGDFIEEIL